METVTEDKAVDSFTMTTESGSASASDENSNALECETGAAAAVAVPVTTGTPVSRSNRCTMSAASARFDRNGKGYLDDTERALRQMDSQNKGFLDVDKVYLIMDSLQTEQKRNAELTRTLLDEQKKALNMKKGVIALSIFAVVLALANVGTSFAAATLAKDMSVNQADLVSAASGERLGVTSKVVSVTVQPLSEESRRRLEGFDCASVTPAGTECVVAGEFTFDEAMKLYQTFCTEYPVDQLCEKQGPEKITLNCVGKISDLFGGSRLPSEPPYFGLDENPASPNYKRELAIFPSISRGYTGMQETGNTDGTDCTTVFNVGNTCFLDNDEPCFVFVSWLPGSCTNPVQLCGAPRSFAPQTLQ